MSRRSTDRPVTAPFVVAVVMLGIAAVLAGPVGKWMNIKHAKLPLALVSPLSALDEEALYEALVSGKLSAAALDVFADEKQDRGQKLFTLPQVIGSPHIGAGTSEAKARVGEEVASIAIRFHEANG